MNWNALVGVILCCAALSQAYYHDAGAYNGTGPVHSNPGSTPTYTYKKVKSYPHDPTAFTQGLVFDEGHLYESTGLRGRSSLRRVMLQTGEVRKIRRLPPHLFGEGITIYKGRIIQLTWISRQGFVYDKTGFSILRKFVYPTEGWGLTHDGSRLIMSDGTSTLYFLDPETFKEVRRITVSDRGNPVKRLNELEYINGEVYANIWTTNRIARVDPGTGRVGGWIDLSGLLGDGPRGGGRIGVLNGIAYDRKDDRIFVTGKLWPRLFEIRLVSVQ